MCYSNDRNYYYPGEKYKTKLTSDLDANDTKLEVQDFQVKSPNFQAFHRNTL